MANPNGNPETLITASERTKEELSAMGKKGIKKAQETKRQKRAVRETFEALLSLPLCDAELQNIDDIKSIADAQEKNVTTQEAIAMQQILKALGGDTRSAEFVLGIVAEHETNDETLKRLDEVLSGINLVDHNI